MGSQDVADVEVSPMTLPADGAKIVPVPVECGPGGLERVGVVVHPTREIDGALGALRDWVAEHDLELVQIEAGTNRKRPVAEFGEVERCDLVVAIGGDGTVLASLRAAMRTGAPVLGVACGSLGALTDTSADHLSEALDHYLAGDWFPRRLPALVIRCEEDGSEQAALNDFVVVRRSGGQVAVDVSVDGELYVRMAGDGVVCATSLGSTAYSMAGGGPIVVGPAPTYVVTPLAMHGGNAPSIVVRDSAKVELVVHPTFSGFDVEVDGRPAEVGGVRYTVTMREDAATLVASAEPDHGLGGLRKRRIVMDSPRVMARDDREARKRGG